MNRILFLLLLFANLSYSHADEAVSFFSKANDYYQKAEFDSALMFYNKVLELDKVSSALYYNMGNSYFKKGMLAEAILFYEKASRLAPHDPEINQNLEIARARTIDKIDPLPQMFYNRWVMDIKNLFSPDAWSVAAVIFFWLFIGSLSFYLLSGKSSIKKISFASAIFLFVFFIFTAWIAYDRHQNLTGGHNAIIFETSVYVKSSPEDKSTNLFMLHEGTKVEILDEISEWRKIRIANGNIGWIKEDAIGVI